jgi:hypothetical protein
VKSQGFPWPANQHVAEKSAKLLIYLASRLGPPSWGSQGEAYCSSLGSWCVAIFTGSSRRFATALDEDLRLEVHAAFDLVRDTIAVFPWRKLRSQPLARVQPIARVRHLDRVLARRIGDLKDFLGQQISALFSRAGRGLLRHVRARVRYGVLRRPVKNSEITANLIQAGGPICNS